MAMTLKIHTNIGKMSFARGSLRAFLATAKTTLQTAIINQQKVTLVIGNDSADLDSITSAIVLAYFRSASIGTPSASSSTNKPVSPSHSTSVYIPVLNIPREDIRIRPELLTLLPYAGLEPYHLITLDDLTATPPPELDPKGRDTLQPQLTDLLLVDHNSLAGPLATKGFSDRVIGVIDHHIDEGTMRTIGNEPWIIDKTGSCTSLVTQFCRPTWDALSFSASSASHATSGQSDTFVGVDDTSVRQTWDAQIATFAIASILDDTHNLTSAEKTTDTDATAVHYLESKILPAENGVGLSWNREAFYELIHTAKQDIDGLTPAEILRKDYKHWDVQGKHLGISSVVKLLTWQIDKAGDVPAFRTIMKDFAKERKLNVFAIMTHDKDDDGNRVREILIWAVNPEDNSIVEKFENEAGQKLGLVKWEERKGLDDGGEGDGIVRVWRQNEVQYSRKQVAPLMRCAMQQN